MHTGGRAVDCGAAGRRRARADGGAAPARGGLPAGAAGGAAADARQEGAQQGLGTTRGYKGKAIIRDQKQELLAQLQRRRAKIENSRILGIKIVARV